MWEYDQLSDRRHDITCDYMISHDLGGMNDIMWQYDQQSFRRHDIICDNIIKVYIHVATDIGMYFIEYKHDI